MGVCQVKGSHEVGSNMQFYGFCVNVVNGYGWCGEPWYNHKV